MKRFVFISIAFFFAAISFLCILLFRIDLTGKSVEKNPATEKKEIILGFSQIGSESAWRTRNTQSVFEAAKNNGIQIIFDDAQQKQSNQIKAIRSFIVYQVDVIAFVPIVEDGWDNVLKEAKDAQIPVIVVDRKINSSPSLYAGYIGEDALEEGKKAGRFLLSKKMNVEKEVYNVMELYGTRNSSVAKGRSEGFRSVIEGSKFKIIYSEDGDFLRSLGKEIAENIIQENNGLFYKGQEIDVIYSHNDAMTLGLLDAFKEYKIDSKDKVIISIDAEQKSIDALKAGKINCVVECNPDLGESLMVLVKDVAQGKRIARSTFMEETVFTENDDFSSYKIRGY